MENKTKGKLSVIFGILGIIILPIIFGPLAVYFGYKTKKAGLKKLGNIGIVFGIVSLVLMIFSSIINKFILFPLLGSFLNTSHPVVAFVSESMTHDENFDDWWTNAGNWYSNAGIDKNKFSIFPYKNGINKGDLLIIKGANYDEIQIGDLIVFWSTRKDPIMHRVTKKWEENEIQYFETKGDNHKTNPIPIRSAILDETKISYDQVIGRVSKTIPKIGWVKIKYAEMLNS
ncbi:MAG: signal peptidase I [Nanoarchaeota archaeon]